MFEEKDPLLRPPLEDASPDELRELVVQLQARVIEITRKLKAKTGKSREQRKDIRRKDVALAKKKQLANEQAEELPEKSLWQSLKFW